jgi:hypothetical protein
LAAALVGFLFITGDDGGSATDTPSSAAPPDNSAAAPPAERRTVVVPELAGAFERVAEDQTRAGSGPTIAAMQAAGIRNAQLGRYSADGTPESQLTLYAGELARSLTPDEVATAGQSHLDAAFQRFVGTGLFTFDGTSRSFDAGPLGGLVRCTTLDGRNREHVVCGWTIGYLLDARRSATEAALAGSLLAVREDVEIVNR